MAQAQLGMFRNSDGHEKPVGAVAIVNPDGSEIARNEHGLTPWEQSVLVLLRAIRDRLPEPSKPASAAKATPAQEPKA